MQQNEIFLLAVGTGTFILGIIFRSLFSRRSSRKYAEYRSSSEEFSEELQGEIARISYAVDRWKDLACFFQKNLFIRLLHEKKDRVSRSTFEQYIRFSPLAMEYWGDSDLNELLDAKIAGAIYRFDQQGALSDKFINRYPSEVKEIADRLLYTIEKEFLELEED